MVGIAIVSISLWECEGETTSIGTAIKVQACNWKNMRSNLEI